MKKTEMKKQKNLNSQNDNQIDFNLEDFQFLGDHVLLKEISVKSSDNGLVQPKQLDDKPEYGIVISCGQKAEGIKKGDIVIFGRYMTEETRHKGQTYFFIHMEDIKGILKNENL